MTSRSLIAIINLFVFLLSSQIHADEEIQVGDRIFLELWSDNSYRKTEFGTDEPDYSEEDYFISQLWIQTGLRYELGENVFFDPHLTFELNGDWGDEEWNDVYWNNSMYWGLGGRLSYESSSDEEDGYLWLSDFNTELFIDLMFNENSLDGAKDDIPEEVSTENLRAGVSLWAAVDTQDFFSGTTSLWSEFYGELTYEDTGFAEKEYENFYVCTIEFLVGPKFPIHEVSLQPYYALYLTRDLGTEEWNKEPWLNNLIYGPGFRVSLGSLIPLENADLYFYTEFLKIDYMSRVDDILFADTAGDDIRIGIEIYLPFGATQDRIRRH